MSYLKKTFKTWYNPLSYILNSNYFYQLGKKINTLYNTQQVAPKKENIFKAFELCDYNDLKIVILGQDPYHDFIGKNPRANGLAFANDIDTLHLSPSLKNIHKELESDLGELVLDFDCSLENWAKQGVLLLNTALTVKKGAPISHFKYWEKFTEEVLKTIVLQKPNTLFVLWGKYAQSYKKILNSNSLVYNTIESAHPSPFSYKKGFKGTKPFTKINEHLKLNKQKQIKWT